MKIHKSPVAFFALFAISGFTGLIYESIWTHYLKLFLGHAAYAQALVLTIFMGGMAFGAYLASRFSTKWSNLLIAYAIVEILIGCFGVVFHPFFQSVLSISYENIIPALGSPGLVHTYKWAIGALIILPQSILLGMTFPLMSNGIIRRFPNTPGRTLGMLYFTNSIGAAIGVLFSGFYLIKTVGLPGTILAAGIINILLAILVYGLAKGPTEQPYSINKSTLIKSPYLILLAAFITGAASFIYEISWIRMLSMVLGASTHAFELMLSAFITGLAFGGLWVRRIIDSLDNPIRTTGYVQIAMGIMALLTLPLYNYSFDLMSFFMSGLERNDPGYQLFTMSSYLICFIIMLPTTFCAGMTLPLFTFIMLRQGYGEKSIGQIYASNTLGAIVGIIFTIFIGMPVLGLKGAILFGCSLDILLGLFLLSRADLPTKKPMVVFATITGIAIGGMVLMFDLDQYKMSSGVFRTGTILAPSENSKVLFHKDAKTSSISVLQNEDGVRTILTNGKADASINTANSDKVTGDEITTTLLAALPLAIYPDAELIANIGMGSGMTTHTLLSWPSIKQVDTIEIEPAIIEGASFFRPRAEKAFTDPRSKIHIEDAKTYFSTYKDKYDIIVSEPSNPWVSGTASLFTDEFYNHISNYLSDKGLFVQWLQAYEFNPQLLFSVLKALNNNFSDFVLYSAHEGDLIIIARNNTSITQPGKIIFNSGSMKKELAKVGINNLQDIETLFIANKNLIGSLIYSASNIPTNSDYFPYLDLNGAQARFKQDDLGEMTQIRRNIVPIIKMLSPIIDKNEATNVSSHISSSAVNKMAYQAQNLFHSLNNLDYTTPENPVASKLKLMATLANSCQSINFPHMWINDLINLATLTVPYLSPNELQPLWDIITPNCNNGLNEDQINWLQLIKALSQRNSESIVLYSSTLLSQNHWDIPKQRIQFTAQMTALVKLKKYQLAQQLWKKNIAKLYTYSPIPLPLLILHSLANENIIPDILE
ncbi:MAG: spermidine synthase [Gammaproteobacteria bacterium]|jgi:spermidine synthase